MKNIFATESQAEFDAWMDSFFQGKSAHELQQALINIDPYVVKEWPMHCRRTIPNGVLTNDVSQPVRWFPLVDNPWTSLKSKYTEYNDCLLNQEAILF
jgi:hypothetical protein